jgi:phenylalanyl-tRNA synthetase beta chain
VEISRDWLSDYVDLPATDELAERLTAIGLAVEGVTERHGDTLLDVDVTTNRPDCMCHLGVAREIAVATGAPLRPRAAQPDEVEEPAADAVAISIEDPEGCPRYAARVIRGVRVGESPEWLRRRLEAIGLRPINNVVDVTNYVLWETGQPLHAFDLEKIAGARIVVRRAAAGERLVTLDGEERELDPEVLVIADAERPVALAGIMGGLESEVTATTRTVLLESAHFDPRRVRRGAARLGMHTDASHRFERGTDPSAPPAAAARAAALLVDAAGGEVLSGVVDVTTAELPSELSGRLEQRRLDGFAGVAIEAAEVERILRGLGFGVSPEGDGSWRVTVPSWRHYDFRDRRPDGDVWEADLFEEVMRHVGFDRIPAALPPVEGPDGGDSSGHELRQRLREVLAGFGLAEAVTFAFHSRVEDGLAPGRWSRGEPVELANPLSELYGVMRRSLVPGLLGAARFNLNRGARAVRLFEVGHLFPAPDAPEVETVAVLAGGILGTPWEGERTLDLFDVKGWMEALGAALGVTVSTRPAGLRGVVAGTGAELVVAGSAVGWLGRLDAPEEREPLYAAEIETAVLAGAERFYDVAAPSRFPAVEADLTLTHPLSLPWAEIAAAIEELRPETLVDFWLQDRYTGEGVPEGAVNTTIGFRYNAPDRSLSQDEVNELHSALSAELARRFAT